MGQDIRPDRLDAESCSGADTLRLVDLASTLSEIVSMSMRLLNDARARAVFAGSVGAFLGWIVAESLWTIANLLFGSDGTWAALGVGSLVGLGIGSALGAAEGIAIRAWSTAARGLFVGMAVGAIGGTVGAAFAQVGYAASSGGSGSFVDPDFSREMQERLSEAGAHEGEIEVALVWHDKNDLDLHVLDPNGERIFFENKRAVRSEGWLDIDMNVNLASAVENPVEHIRWPHNSVPKGAYQVFVHYYGQHVGQPAQSPFEVGIKIGGRAASFKGTVSREQQLAAVHTFTYPMSGVSSANGGSNALTTLVVILGWTLFGALIGCAEGIRRRSLQALRNASLGGAIGGSLGGIVLVFAVSTVANGTIGRMLGFVILGACIGLFIVLVERALSAVLRVRSGRYEGREIFLDKPEMRIGRNDALEIFLGGDTEVAKHHATLCRKGAGHTIVVVQGKLQVNDAPVTSRLLENGDTLVLGQTRLVYRHKRANGDGGTPTAEQSQSARPKALAPPPAPPPPGKRAVSRPTPSTSPTTGGSPDSPTAVRTPTQIPRKPPPPPPRRS